MGKFSDCQNYIFYKRLCCRRKEGLLRIYFQDRNGVVYVWMPKWKDVARIFWRGFRTELEHNRANDITPFKRVVDRIAKYVK